MIVTTRYYLDLVSVLTDKEIRIRYKSSVFGYLWSLANPVCFAVIYHLAFKVFMRVPIEDYALFLICGLFAWQWLSCSISHNLGVFAGNAQMVKKTGFPRSALPLSIILMEGFHFLLSLPVIIFCLYVFDKEITYSLFFLIPVLLVIQTLMAYGFSLIFSSLTLFFRDIERFVQLTLTALFYATPILYSTALMPETYHWIIDYNPFAKLIILWRDLFLTGGINIPYLIDTSLIAIISLFIGFYIFNQLKHRFAEVL